MRLLGTSALVPDLLVRAPEVLRLLAAPGAGPAPTSSTRDPAERRGVAAHDRRPPARPAGRRGHRPVAAPPRDAADRVRATCSACWTSSRCARRSARCGWRCCRRRSGSVLRALGGADAARPDRGDRHGPARRRRAGLRQRRRRAVRLRARGRRRRPRGREVRDHGGRDGAAPARRARARTRRWSSTPTCARRAGPGPLVRTLRVLPRVLRPLVGDLGGAGPAAGPPGRGRRRPRPPVRRDDRPDPLPGSTASRGAGHRDPADQGAGGRRAAAARRRPRHAHQARPRRPGRRRVDGAAAAAAARR